MTTDRVLEITGEEDLDQWLDSTQRALTLHAEAHARGEMVVSAAEGGFNFGLVLSQLLALADAGIIPHVVRLNQTDIDLLGPLHAVQTMIAGGGDASQLVIALLPLILSLVAASRRRPTAPPTQTSNEVPVAPPVTPAAPASGGSMQLTSLRASILFGEQDRKGGSSGPEWNPNDPNQVQMKTWRVHFDCTPTPDDPAYNETLVGSDGNPKKPRIEPRWGRVDANGKEVLNWNSSGEPDHFGLESWEKKGPDDTSGPGLTPVLLLNEQFGSGTVKCFLYFVLRAEYNDGLALESNRVYWRAD